MSSALHIFALVFIIGAIALPCIIAAIAAQE